MNASELYSIPYQGAYMDEAREHYKTRLKYHEALNSLRSLMAVINSDGGHEASIYPSDAEAAEVCQVKIYEMKAQITELELKIKTLQDSLDAGKCPF